MILEYSNKALDGIFTLTIHEQNFDWTLSAQKNLIHILWNDSHKEVVLEIDGYPVVMRHQEAITITYYHQVNVLENMNELVVFSFNREFYCIHDHDKEVSCNGIIFFGAQQQAVISLTGDYQNKFELLLKVFIDEFGYKDNIQGEMLMMLLKRLIILCTRLAKRQSSLNEPPYEEVELIRKFNYLVDQHYKKLKTVKEYADLLYKSPKTLSNVFSKIGKKTPLQIIHERIALEARRLLTYTDRNINEIAYNLGFEEPSTFFKIFKKYTGETPHRFREGKNTTMGNIAI